MFVQMKDHNLIQGEIIVKKGSFSEKNVKKISSSEPLGQFKKKTWHKASLCGGIQLCSNDGPRPSPRGDNSETV